MDKWFLLLLSGAAMWFTVDMARWLGVLQKAPQKDLEDVIGLGANKNPPEIREMTRPFAIRLGLGFLLMLFFLAVAVTIALSVATFKAFVT